MIRRKIARQRSELIDISFADCLAKHDLAAFS